VINSQQREENIKANKQGHNTYEGTGVMLRFMLRCCVGAQGSTQRREGGLSHTCFIRSSVAVLSCRAWQHDQLTSCSRWWLCCPPTQKTCPTLQQHTEAHRGAKSQGQHQQGCGRKKTQPGPQEQLYEHAFERGSAHHRQWPGPPAPCRHPPVWNQPSLPSVRS
jgi:hypothetical protein